MKRLIISIHTVCLLSMACLSISIMSDGEEESEEESQRDKSMFDVQ